MTDDAAARTGLAFNLDVNDGGGILNPGGIARPAIKDGDRLPARGADDQPLARRRPRRLRRSRVRARDRGLRTGRRLPQRARRSATSRLEGVLGLAEPLHGLPLPRHALRQPLRRPARRLHARPLPAPRPDRQVAGKLEPDPATGRLVATFDQLPRLLYTHFSLTLREGQRSTLVSPTTCGPYQGGLQFSSWAEPSIFTSDFSLLLHQPRRKRRPLPGRRRPALRARPARRLDQPAAAAYTPFYLRMTRTDAEQEITSYSATFPPGLLAKIAGVSDCPDAAIAAAKARTGPQAVGKSSTTRAAPPPRRSATPWPATASAASSPGRPATSTSAGPYHGAPLSVVAIDSALIGPFDLGVVVVRSAIRIDPHTAQAVGRLRRLGPDPPHPRRHPAPPARHPRLPSTAPTSPSTRPAATRCGSPPPWAAPAPTPSASPTTPRLAPRSATRCSNCSVLGFKPRLALRLRGGTATAAPCPLCAPPTRRAPATPTSRAVSVTLPPSIFLAQSHIVHGLHPGPVRRRELPAGLGLRARPRDHPADGRALEGPVYLRSSSNTAARPGRRPARARHPDRSRRPHRLLPRRPARQLRRPARRAGEQVHDDPAGRQGRPARHRRQPLLAPRARPASASSPRATRPRSATPSCRRSARARNPPHAITQGHRKSETVIL